ncbi:hypothetical protein BGW38_004356 [Lunasporangiospora selenospora]|uniref:Amine oxidase domain-containing protein n=1 Tax=Lunasporangiospora selenospora TaxID=979761 RepID=A0A9P6FRF5_9FUNG|nr:hypothetical protein BGW38_004356 [Lunasporangiospora selenospora]
MASADPDNNQPQPHPHHHHYQQQQQQQQQKEEREPTTSLSTSSYPSPKTVSETLKPSQRDHPVPTSDSLSATRDDRTKEVEAERTKVGDEVIDPPLPQPQALSPRLSLLAPSVGSNKNVVGQDMPNAPSPSKRMGESAIAEIPKKMRVAVVGSGLAGLTIAHVLSLLGEDEGEGAKIDVHLFEKASKLEYYPSLVRLYRSIGVQFHDADNTLACYDIRFSGTPPSSSPTSRDPPQTSSTSCQAQEPYLSSRSYTVGQTHTVTLPDLPPLSILNPYPFGRRVLGYFRIARDYLKLLFISKEFMNKGRMMDVGKHPVEWGNGRLATVREFLEGESFSEEFSAFFVPLFASICTCSYERMMEYPACVVLEYVARCMPFGRMQFVSDKIEDVTARLADGIDNIHFNTSIEQVLVREEPHRNKGHPTGDSESEYEGVSSKSSRDSDEEGDDDNGRIVLVDSNGQRRTFDHVVFATQANLAAATLAGIKPHRPLPKPYVRMPPATTGRPATENNYAILEEHSRCYEPDLTSPEAKSQQGSPKEDPSGLKTIPGTNPFAAKIRTLTKFPYERTRIVCHKDESFMPPNRRQWRMLNIAKSSRADVLASPLARMSKELEEEMAAETKRQRRPSVASLRNTTLQMLMTGCIHPGANTGSEASGGGTLKTRARSRRGSLSGNGGSSGSNGEGGVYGKTPAPAKPRPFFAPFARRKAEVEPSSTSSSSVRTVRRHSQRSVSPSAGGKSASLTASARRDTWAMATHIMNRTTPTTRAKGTTIFQTLNPIYEPRKETVISSSWFERAVVNKASVKAVDELSEQMEAQTERWSRVWRRQRNDPSSGSSEHSSSSAASSMSSASEEEQGRAYRRMRRGHVEGMASKAVDEDDDVIESISAADRVWFVGSYAYPGIPLLEGCVASAFEVAERMMIAMDQTQILEQASKKSHAGKVLAHIGELHDRRRHRKGQRRSKQEKGLARGKLSKGGASARTSRPTATSTYFQTAWINASKLLRDDSAKDEERRSAQRRLGRWGQWWKKSTHLEIAWMLTVYLVAIFKWFLNIVRESSHL